MPTEATPCLFLDRDGIINEEPPEGQRYLVHPEDFHLRQGIVEAIRVARDRGYRCVVVTNQKCIALGILDEAGLARIHGRMHQCLSESGVRVDAVYHCPHSEEDHCDCRKPLPGMLFRASRELGLDLHRSWMVGDRPRDCEAGKAAGCAGAILVREGATSEFADRHLSRLVDLPATLGDLLPAFESDRI